MLGIWILWAYEDLRSAVLYLVNRGISWSHGTSNIRNPVSDLEMSKLSFIFTAAHSVFLYQP